MAGGRRIVANSPKMVQTTSRCATGASTRLVLEATLCTRREAQELGSAAE